MVKEYFLLETIINDEREKPESPQNKKKASRSREEYEQQSQPTFRAKPKPHC